MKILLNTFGVGFICLMLCASVFAQATSGSQVSGTVQDPTKGVVPGAQVTITQLDTGLTRTATSGEDGSYTIPNLPVGAYQLFPFMTVAGAEAPPSPVWAGESGRRRP